MTTPRRPPEWMDEERRLFSLSRELGRITRRARRRPWLVLLGAAVVASLVVIKVARKPDLNTARMLLRVTEGELTEGATPLPSHELRNYIWHVAFSKPQLLQVIDEFGLYQRRRALHGDEFAIATLRDWLDIDVYRNYFVMHKGYSTAPRSARIAIYFTHDDRETAWRVAHRLAELVRERETELRRRASELAHEQAMLAVRRAQQTLAARQAELSATLVALAAAEELGDEAIASQMRYHMMQLHKLINTERELLHTIRGTARSLDLQRALDANQLGLTFDIIDAKRPDAKLRQWLDLTAIGVVAFFFLVPLSVLAVGSFDRRIRDGDDVRRAGLDVVGHVPGFPGHREGALASRR